MTFVRNSHAQEIASFFKIIAKGEITQHFKKRMMAGCPAYIVNVVSPDTFLARRNAIRRRYEFSSKIRFQRSHTSTDKQQARVVFGISGKLCKIRCCLLLKNSR